MRTIKFKAKRLDNKEWTCGYFYEENDNTYIIENLQKKSMLNRNIPYKVAPATVCQFTGFLDKNGKEIYEGDVLRSDLYPFSCIEDNAYDNYYGTIGWSEEEASFYIMAVKNPKSSVRGISDGICDTVTQKIMLDFEVVGNIHEEKWQQYGEYFKTEEEKEADND